ncbi:DUF2891 family protein [Sinomonas halotolerans]|uniref:DUF2891 family protein n=1 Tax=Sinomonas halotolerans TaxID=1644133 RepID=A0ABU9X2X1_9MICC
MDPTQPRAALFPAAASRCAAVVLENLVCAYPYAAHHTRRSPRDTAMPHELHPAFGTSFDWHSCVHMHWLGVSMLGAGETGPGALDPVTEARLRDALDANLTAENLAVEAAYLAANPSWERPYGWAWLVRLAAACASADDGGIRAWGAALAPCADAVEELVVAWLGKAEYPVRHGVHGNSAFGLALLVDAFRALGRDRGARACEAAALRWFADDSGWPSEWELSGNDFLSAGLSEADLMHRVLAPADFAAWFGRFLPRLDAGSQMLRPVAVTDESDGHLVHLHGLNLSRAGQAARIAAALLAHDADGPGSAGVLASAAVPLFEAGLQGLESPDFMSTHWLASFAWDAKESLQSLEAFGVL